MNEFTRNAKQEKQTLLFDIEPDWNDHWWGMPEYKRENNKPYAMISLMIRDSDALKKLADIGIDISAKTAQWFPQKERAIPGEEAWIGEKIDSKYPICIPSKGRFDCQTTGKALDRMGVSYRFFVEETEFEKYCEYIGEEKVVSMPFHDLGKGSIPARNFIWEWAKERGFNRHWTIDDNIQSFYINNFNKRRLCLSGSFFRAMEDFVDRYKNIPMAGPHAVGFVNDYDPNYGPIFFNSRIYSCILLDTNASERWRGKYNEDTDLSLRFLKQGKCTLLFKYFLMSKHATVGCKNAKPLKGGNTDNVYNSGDMRLAFAQSLADQHPDCVKVVWKYGRWHHYVDYSAFKKNKPILRDDVIPNKSINNYGMQLVKKSSLPA